MTLTPPAPGSASSRLSTPTVRRERRDSGTSAAAIPSQPRATQLRPWSALVCGTPGDSTLLVVDWLVLACRRAGYLVHAVPVASGKDAPHGMYIEVSAFDAAADSHDAFGDAPWGAVDVVIAGEHLELVRALHDGWIDRDVTTVIASCRREYTPAEHVAAPELVMREQEIDDAVRDAALEYIAFDARDVASWYHLPSSAEPALLAGALCGAGLTDLDVRDVAAAIDDVGIESATNREGLRRGLRLGRRPGGRVRRTKTAYQFTRRRRALVTRTSRAGFEQLVQRVSAICAPLHVSLAQEAVYRLVRFQDATWAERFVDELEAIIEAERACPNAPDLDHAPHRSIVADAIRSFVALMTWNDAAWVAQLKSRPERLKALRAAHGIRRVDAFELIDVIPLDERDRSALRHDRINQLNGTLDSNRVGTPPLLQPVRVERIVTTSVAGARRLSSMAHAAARRNGSTRQRDELDTLAAWLETMHDALRTDHELARIAARSGTLVQGGGAVREAHRATAESLWGRVIRQSIAIDRAAGRQHELTVARMVIPFVWTELCRSGPLAAWEYAAQVLGIAMAHARGASYDAVVGMCEELCQSRRPAT